MCVRPCTSAPEKNAQTKRDGATLSLCDTEGVIGRERTVRFGGVRSLCQFRRERALGCRLVRRPPDFRNCVGRQRARGVGLPKIPKRPRCRRGSGGTPSRALDTRSQLCRPTLESTPSLLSQQSVVLRAHACDLGE